MKRLSLEKLRALSREFDVFEPAARDWTALAARELCPPLPLAGDALVWGFPLLAAAERAGRQDLACIELETGDRGELLMTALRLENRAGAYARPEQARLYRLLDANGLLDRLPELLPLITDEKPATWLPAMRDYAGFPEELKRMADEKLLDAKTASRLKTFPKEFFADLYRSKERFTFSQRRQLALFLWEISRRDRLGEEEALALSRGLLAEQDPWPRLRALRFPEFTKLIGRFSEITAGLEREGITVRPPPGFEGEEFSFGFTAVSRAGYRKKMAALRRFEGQVDRLFELL